MTAQQQAGLAAIGAVRNYATEYDEYISAVIDKADEAPLQGKLTAVQIHGLVNHLRLTRNNNDTVVTPEELGIAIAAWNANNDPDITIAADEQQAIADALEPLIGARRQASGILYTDSINAQTLRPVLLDTDLGTEALAQLAVGDNSVYVAISNGLDRRLTGATVDHDAVVNGALAQRAPLVQQASGITPANSAAYTQAAQNFMVQAGEYFDLSSRMTWGTTDTTNAAAGNAYLAQVRDALTAAPATAIPEMPADLAALPGYRELYDSFVESTRAKLTVIETLDELGVAEADRDDVALALSEEGQRAGALRGAFAPDQLDSDVIAAALNDVQAGLGDEVGRVAGATGQAVDAGGSASCGASLSRP
jgi:hypothetical protein